jgi:hypothetical protein
LQEEKLSGHAEILLENCTALFQRLYEQDGSASEILTTVARDLTKLIEIDPSFSRLVQDCEQHGSLWMSWPVHCGSMRILSTLTGAFRRNSRAFVQVGRVEKKVWRHDRCGFTASRKAGKRIAAHR